MTKAEVLAHFKNNQSAVARALGVSRSAVSKWPEEIPALRQIQIEEVTAGVLKADRATIYASRPRRSDLEAESAA